MLFSIRYNTALKIFLVPNDYLYDNISFIAHLKEGEELWIIYLILANNNDNKNKEKVLNRAGAFEWIFKNSQYGIVYLLCIEAPVKLT